MSYGWLNTSSSDNYVNDSAAIVCDPGYTLDGPSTAICTQNGSWDTSSTRCIPKNCTNPPLPPKHGYISSVTGLSVNSTAILSCNRGYNLTGNNKTQCTYNETWSPVSTLCSLIECSALSLLDHGFLNISNGQRYVNDTASVVCDPGYIPEGSQIATCTEDGRWDISLTKCLPRNCSMPVEPANGIVQVPDGLAVNSTAVVTCGEGFDLNGESVITCLENGTWSDADGFCTIKECKNPQAPRNGSFTTHGGIIVNSTAFFECDTGYNLHGNNISTCLSDGNWSFEAPLCLPINCSKLTPPHHGTLSLSKQNLYQSAGQFYCNEGYNLVGFKDTECLSSGNWSNTTPSCTPVDCRNWTYANVTWMESGYVTYSPDTLFGSTAISFCKPGFQVNSTMKSLAATCTSNGTWSKASPPLCVKVECPPISVPENENITLKYSNGFNVNSTATFTCTEPGSQINGFTKVTCLQTGEWTGSSPTCKRIEKDISPCPGEKDYRGTKWTETKPGMISTKECSHPEMYIGEVSRQCTVNGTWKLPVYNCIRQEIDNVNKQIEAIKENPSAEVVTEALDKLNDITKTTEEDGSLYSGEIEKVTSILDSIANISTKTDVTHNQAEAFLETTSNLLDTSNTESWTAISQEPEDADKTTQQAKGAAKILDVVSRYSDAVTRSLNNSTNTSQTVSAKNLVLHVTKVNENSDGVMFPEKSKNIYNLKSSFHLPKESLKGLKHVSSVLYKNLTGILSSKTISDGQIRTNQEINSEVVAVKVEDWENNKKHFQITLALGHFQGKFSDRQCSFWNTNRAAWDGEGCKLNTTSSSSSKSICVCNHLTNFAILMSPWEEENVDSKAIDIISTVGCSISLVALVITITFHVILWRYVKSDRVVILINLSIALVISYSIFLGGVDRTENKDACTAVAALLQYIYLVVFFLMLAEGIEISVTVLYVFTTASRIKWLLPAAWLIPAVIVGISLGATQLKGYGNDQFCWLSVQGGLIWAFVAPAFIIIVVNFVLLILILRAAFGASTLAQKSKKEKTKAGVKCLCVLLPLMGCTWVIGIFYVNKNMAWIQYVFAVCNSLQGLVIFIFHCALNKQIRAAIERRRKKYASSFLSTASSTKPFSMPRASTSSSSISDRMERSHSISRDDVSNKSMSTFERNNSERNTFEMKRL